MLTIPQIRQILEDVTFDNWNFVLVVEPSFYQGGGEDRKLYLQLSFTAPDLYTGKEESWTGRKWLLSTHMTQSEIVQTALKAVLTAVEHEARERFLYKGKPIFGPHIDVEQLLAICHKTDERQAAKTQRTEGEDHGI